ncbi:MAG: hypothetical protein HQL82_08385 [Magnetococcales bacterium]|nr:hypothetical protein [Magnetococcales bacterium]
MDHFGICNSWISTISLALYARLTRKVVYISPQSRAWVPGFLARHVRTFENDRWREYLNIHEIDQRIIHEPRSGHYSLVEKGLVRLLAAHWGTLRMENVFLRAGADLHLAFIRDALASPGRETPFLYVIPNLLLWRRLAERELPPNQVRISFLLTLCFLAATAVYGFRSWLRYFRFRPTVERRRRWRLMQVISLGFTSLHHNDATLMERMGLSPEEMAFLSVKPGGNNSEHCSWIRDHGLTALDLYDSRFNIASAVFFRFLVGHLLLGPFHGLLFLLLAPSQAGYYAAFLTSLFPCLRLFSRNATPFVVGGATDETRGLQLPISGELCGTRTLIIGENDTGLKTDYCLSFTAHHVYFLWGRRLGENYLRQGRADEIYGVGCPRSNSYPRRPREETIQALGFDPSRPIVIFFDNEGRDPFGLSRFSSSQAESFYRATAAYARDNPDVQVIMKPKRIRTLEPYRHLIDPWVRCFTSDKIWYGDLVEMADVTVGMGTTNVTQIALYMGATVVIFDESGCRTPVFEPYEGTLVVRDAPALFRRLDGIIRQGQGMPEIPELEWLNVKGADPFALVGQYVREGRLDANYRIPFSGPGSGLFNP